jgi:hypothetical protein
MVRYSSSNTKGIDDEHYDVGVAAKAKYLDAHRKFQT